MTIVFFGSFQSYSVQVLEALRANFTILAVVTTPLKPKGRHMKLTPTAVEIYARGNKIPVYALASLEAIPNTLGKPDFSVVAGYGKRIPSHWLRFPRVMSINMHSSLLPYYRGAFPAEWAILKGEKETGVSIVQMTEEFDKGLILAQKRIAIATEDTRESLYKKLYELGAALLVNTLPKIASREIKPQLQPAGTYFYARRLTREDGFIPWEKFHTQISSNSDELSRRLRALQRWPGIWTTTPQGKRLKLITLKPEIIVQLEGKKPVPFSQFSSAYLFSKSFPS